MTKAIRKLFSLMLVAVMLLSLVAPALPVISASAASDETTTEDIRTSDLRFGVLSDIHISYDYVDDVYGNVTGHFNGVQPSRFEKALRFFKAQGVDAVVVAGDLQEASGTDAATLDKSKDWLQTVVDIWFKVFPEGRGAEGYVEPIFIYGNHDSALVSTQYWPEELGSYQDAFIKEVNGYSFVCSHNAKEYLAAPLLEKVAPYNQDKPIFYVQHCPVAYTVPGADGQGYGVGYGADGRDNIASYHNVVAMNGHTHAPLTDERSIWQGDSGNEGQFTVLNTATINYSGLANDDMSINSFNGNAQQTEHGMLIDVYGSEVSVERYSFNDMTIDTTTGKISGNAVKIGQTWQWDACDATDRPYAYDSRYENANAPAFYAGASVTVNSVSDNSVTVTVPAASITPPAGFSDMIEGYVVEACNPTSGEVEATGRVATSYHVDSSTEAYESSYTIQVNGLKSGTNYTLKIYAQDFYDKRSEPLTVNITTTGTITSFRRGDVNKDGIINGIDLMSLRSALAIVDKNTYDSAMDIDQNGVLEERDIVELQAILNVTQITYPESTDLMDLVHKVKLTGVSTSTQYQPVDYGTVIQNQVVRGDSNQAVKTWTTNYAYYPKTTMYFSEPVDLSGYSHLSFDTLFENEDNMSDSYRMRWMSVSLISGNQEQLASYGSMNFDPNGDGWTTTTIILSNLKNIDLTAVTGIRFEHNFDYYAGRFDGVTEHAIYWDNFYGVLIDSAESDMLGSATITGGQFTSAAGSTNNTSQAIESVGGSLDVKFQDAVQLSEYAGFYVDMRTPVATTVAVQILDTEGDVLGEPVEITTYNIYQNKFIAIADFGISGDLYAAGLRFTYGCDSLLLDNMTTKGSKDSDWIGTAAAFAPVGDGVNASVTLDNTNKSNNALWLHADSVVNGGVVISLPKALTLTDIPYLRFDLKMENVDPVYTVAIQNSADEIVWSSGALTAGSTEDYGTYELDLSSCADLRDVVKVAFSFNFSEDGNVWLDNMKACNPLADFFGASTSLLGPSAVQDGFVCEILPVTEEGRTDVLHWFADPTCGGGTTSAWPGETTVTITKDVLFANHTGYDASDLDYLEFTIKNVGNYVAFSFSFKDASGALLGSSNGEYRVSLEEDWTTYRIDLLSSDLTPEEVSQIHSVTLGWNWQYQNVNGTETKKVADIYIDNMGFSAYPEDTTDKLDQIGLIRNSEWWWGGNNTYPEAGWLYQSDVTVDSDKAFIFYRGANTHGLGYSPRILYAYFNEPITVAADWTISLDVINQNFAKNSRLEIVGSDNKAYTCFAFNGTGAYSLETLVSALATSDGVAFDPATVSIKGLKYHTNYNRDASVSTTEGGYLVLDNLCFTAPKVIPVVDLNGYELIDNAASVEINLPNSVEDNFVFEVLDQADGRTDVVHLYGDPANGGGITGSSNYIGMILKLSNEVKFNGENVDFLEFSLKNTNIYCDSTFATFYDAAGKKLAEGSVRSATTNDWSTYRMDLTKLGMTQEEIATIASVNFRMNWSKQLSTAAAPVIGEVYVDDLRFGSYVDSSTDMFDHIGVLNNTEWWWSGNNYYDNAGWQLIQDADGSTYYKIYRVKDKTSTSTGYNPRRQYLYFDAPITLEEDFVVKLDATNTYMGTGTKISLLGDDGNKYGYLLINKTGSNTYEMSISDFVLLNADTTMTTTNTPIDISAVKIIGAIFHDDFFSGDQTQDGSLVMDNFYIGSSTPVEPEPSEPEPSEPEPTEPTPTLPDNGDLLYKASFAYNQNHWGGETGLAYAKDTENVCDNKSVQSWSFKAAASAKNSSAIAQMLLDKAYDFTNCYVVFDAKYVTDSTAAQNIGVRLHNTGWGNHNDINVSASLQPGNWQTCVLDFSSVLLATSNPTDLKLISFYFDFASNTGYERAVYIDNVRLVKRETVQDDWINMSIDGGMSEMVTHKVVTDHTYGDSAFALRVETGEGYRVTFNPQAAVINGTLSAKVNMTSGGLIGGYFYFGDQTPNVKVRLTDKNWNGGASLPLELIDLGDGWYYGYMDAQNMYFYDSATNPTKEEIIRVSLIFPSNYTVYIDQFKYPATIPADVVDYRIVYDADVSKAVASDVKVRLENDTDWLTDVVADSLPAVSNEIVLGATSRSSAKVAEYLTGGAKELGEFDYAVVVENGKIYLVANTNAGIYQALDKLVELASAGKIADGVYLKDDYDTTDVAELADGADIRVMSYNLLYSTEYLVEDRIGNFLNIIGYYKPDVIGLQETSGGSNQGWHEYIHDALIRDGIYQKACKESDSIATLMTTFIYNPDTVRLLDEYVIDLEEGSQIRVLAVAVFERIVDGQRFIVTNTHPAPYGSVNYTPNLQAMLTAANAELAKYAGLPVIMVGDFNTEEDQAEYQTIMDTLNVVDTKYAADTMVRAYNTWSGFGVAPIEGSAYCIDHIFANKYVDTKLYNVIIDHDVEHTSDHIPLYADLKISGIEPQVGADDMLHGATAADTLGFFAGEPYFYNAEAEFVNGDESITSFAVGTTYGAGDSSHRWPTGLICFDEVYDMTDKNLVFDVYFDYPNTASNIKSLTVSLYNSGWAQITDQMGPYKYADGWHRIEVDPTDALRDGYDLTAVRFIKLHVSFYGGEGEHVIYLDNMHLVDRGTPNMTTENASDLMANARVEFNVAEWGGPVQYINPNYTGDTYGTESWKSFKIAGSGSASVQLHMVNSFDLTGKDLAFDVKFIGAQQHIGLKLYNGWSQRNSEDIVVIGTGSDGWQTVVISAEDIIAACGSAPMNDVFLLQLSLNFASDAAGEHAILIDNMRAVAPGSEDSGDVETPTEPTPTEPEVTEPETTVPAEDVDLFDRATISNMTKQSALTNGSTSAWKLTPGATGWSYPEFVFDGNIDISKYELVMDIYPANMKNFRMHLATINGDWGAGSGAAVYYSMNQWTTIKYNLSSNTAGYQEMSKFSLGIDFAAEGSDYALYIDNVKLVERKMNADATEETEKASDMLAIATYEWSATDWSGASNYSYDKESDETNGKDSIRSWKFSVKNGGGYSRMQIKLNKSYDMSNKDLVFDLKFDPAAELKPLVLGLFLQNSQWQTINPNENYKEMMVTVSGEGWHTIRIDNSILQANVLDGFDLTSVYFVNLSVMLPSDVPGSMYIDNMRLEDHVTCTDEEDAKADLLVNATIVQNSADNSVYFYDHANTNVSCGSNSNASHKFSATRAGNGYHTVKYDLGTSYDLTGKNVVMDVLSFHSSTTFLFQLYDSNNKLITSAYRGCTAREWTEVTPAILSNDLDLTDIRYIAIGAYFDPDSTQDYRAFYVDNVRIDAIDTYHTELENKNIVFIGDSITASGGYKGWSGELEEHYFINRYNLGAGGTSYAEISGRGKIFSQTASIPANLNVDYFVLNGGVNDIWSAVETLGTISSIAPEDATVDDFDFSTTVSGMEKTFCYLRTNYPNAKIGFVITYNCFDSGFDAVRYRDEFVPTAKAVCDKWDIPYLDLVNNEAFNAEFDAMKGAHTYDGVHANDVGYDLIMRQIAPWLLGMTKATEATEQNSDLLAYANKEWSPQTWNDGGLTFNNASAEVYGPYSTRSWQFGSNGIATTAQMQIKLPPYAIFDLSGKAIQFDVKFDGTMSQKIGMNLYNSNWKDLMNNQVAYVEGNGTSDWQTFTFDASVFESYLVDDATLDNIYLFKIYLPFSATAGVTQNIYIDNFRCVDIHNVATEESEADSDLLYGAKYVSGNFTNNGFGYSQHNTMFVSGKESKYSLNMYADTGSTAWCNARFELPEILDLTNKSLVFDVNQYQHVYIGVAVYDINNELVASDGFTLRNSGWQTFEVNLLGGIAEGKTVADLARIKYINFSSSFETSKIGRVLYVDNVHVYENVQYDTALNGLNGLYLGDSISEAISYKGWAGELAEHYGVNAYNVSASGAVVINNKSHNLHQQLAKAPTDVDFDFVMLNGGVNDVWQGHALGEVSAEGTTEFNVDTTIGALEDLFATLKQTYPQAEIFFVLNYVCVQAGYPSDTFRNEFAPLARAACEKWGVHCLDLVDNDDFNTEFDASANVHTYDGVHANTAGYNVITKYIVPWLEGVFGKIEASEETEKASDLVASATLGTASFTAARPFLSYNKQCTEEVYGDQSLYSLKLAYDGTLNDNHDSWPYIWINFGKNTDFTGKKLVFDVKIVCDVASQSISVRQLLNSSWSAISSTTKSVSVTAGEWTTVEFNIADFAVNEGYSLENVNLFGIQMAFTKGVAETIYIDNVRLVDVA